MLSKFFIDRPIFATVLSVLITLTGAIAMVFLPVAQYPLITPPSVSVSISYPGASAQVVAETVAAPIEQQVNGVPGMLYMSSRMGNDGSYSLSVTFDVGVDLNTALVMVQNRVTLAMPLLPSQVQNQGITIRKKTPDLLCMINLISPDQRYNDIDLSNYALINLKDELLRVDGVADVSIMGERDYSIRLWLDPQKLSAHGLTPIDVETAIRNDNQQAVGGQLGQPPNDGKAAYQLPLNWQGRLSKPEQFEEIIVKAAPDSKAGSSAAALASVSPGGLMAVGAGSSPVPGGLPASSGMTDTTANVSASAGTTGSTTQPTAGGLGSGGSGTLANGSSAMSGKATAKSKTGSKGMPSGSQSPSMGVIRVRDVARVEMGAQNYNQFCSFRKKGEPSEHQAVGLSVYQLPGTNALDVIRLVRDKMKELKQRFPDGVVYLIEYDTTPFIEESIHDVEFTLVVAVALVAVVVLFFLQDWRAMILPMIDVPVSLIGTFAVMKLLGYSLNNISLFGLVLAIGIVVDDAIVVLENIERQLAKGYDPRTATIKAMEEITGPILAITMVLCAVFVPCAFLPGITGRFFRQFAVTISASMIISAINALTMTPSRALFIFKHKGAAHDTPAPEPEASAKDASSAPPSHQAAAPQTAVSEHKREALPWWIFGLAGGLATLWLASTYLTAAPGAAETVDDSDQSDLVTWMWRVAYFSPGLLVGLVIGWFIIGPLNAGLGVFFQGFNRLFDRMTNGYGWIIGKALHGSGVVLMLYCGMLAVTWWVFQAMPKGFVPQQDQGRLTVSVKLDDASALEQTQIVMKQVDNIIHEFDGVACTIGLGGISFAESVNGPNFGSFFVILNSFEKRRTPELRADAIKKALEDKFKVRIPEVQIAVAGAAPVPGLSATGGFKVMVQDLSGQEELPKLQAVVDGFIDDVKKLRIGDKHVMKNASTQFRANTPQLNLKIDHEKAASLGVSLDDLNRIIQTYLGSLYVNSFNAYGRHWQVTMQADSQFRSRTDAVKLFQVRNSAGQMVPLGTLVNLVETTGPFFVARYNLYTAVPVNGSPEPGVSSGVVIEQVDETARKMGSSIKAAWTELMYLQIQESQKAGAGVIFALAVLCVFLALAALYESWTLPLAVILVVPLCVLCSLAGTWFSSLPEVGIFVQIGLVVLVGLACKNAILVVEFAKQLHADGQSLFDATLTASKLRLRPILMTSLAFILGVLPLCFASGAGAEMRWSLGTAVFSGMVGVTFFGIFLTPVFFYVIQGLGETRLFASPAAVWTGSLIFGCFLGALGGYLLAMLGVVGLLWGVVVGAAVGILAVLAVLGIQQRLWGR